MIDSASKAHILDLYKEAKDLLDEVARTADKSSKPALYRAIDQIDYALSYAEKALA